MDLTHNERTSVSLYGMVGEDMIQRAEFFRGSRFRAMRNILITFRCGYWQAIWISTHSDLERSSLSTFQRISYYLIWDFRNRRQLVLGTLPSGFYAVSRLMNLQTLFCLLLNPGLWRRTGMLPRLYEVYLFALPSNWLGYFENLRYVTRFKIKNRPVTVRCMRWRASTSIQLSILTPRLVANLNKKHDWIKVQVDVHKVPSKPESTREVSFQVGKRVG